MLTVWIPVFDATEENGCLRVVPRNHRAGLLHHCTGPSGYYLSEAEFDVERAVAVPMRRGSAALHAPTDAAFVPTQRERRRPVEHGSPLSPERPADGETRVPRIRRPEP